MAGTGISRPAKRNLFSALPMWHRFGRVLTIGSRVLLSKYRLRACSRVGALPRVWGKPRIVNRGALTIGDRSMIVSRIVPVELVANQDARLTLGDRVYINFGTTIAAYEHISIGNRVVMGVYTIISDNDQHQLDPERRSELPESQPVVIEDDVWIGDRVTILKGVRIGSGAVIGAGSVVTKDVPPGAVVAGNPARIIRHMEGIAREAVNAITGKASLGKTR